MADDRTRHILEVVGARQFVASFAAAQQAVDSLTVVAGSSGVRQRQTYDIIGKAAEEAANRQEQAAKRVERALKDQTQALQESATKVTPRTTDIAGATRGLDQQHKLNDALKALQQSYVDLKVITKALDEATVSGANASAAARKVQAEETRKLRDAEQAAAQKLAITQGPARGVSVPVGAVTSPSGAFRGLGLGAEDPNTTTGKRLAEQRAQLDAQRTAAQQLQGVLVQTAAVTGTVTQANTRKTQSIVTQSAAEDNAKRHSITYLSALSAVHAMSFLLGNQTFTNIGSLTTLGLAFGKVGALAGVAGIGLGLVLLGIQSVVNATNAIQQAMIAAVQTIVDFGVKGAAAMVAFGAAGVKAAADVETQFALLKGITGESNTALRITEGVVSELAIEFGVAANKVAEAGSFFVRAGGNLGDLEKGALRAILALQAASGGELEAAQAARTLATAMNQYNLEGDQAGRVANVVAGAAQKSALSFTEVSQSFQQAIPGARLLNISLEDMGAVVAVLGDQLRGSLGGTAFKQFFLDLVNPSVRAKQVLAEYGVTLKDATTGAARPFEDVLLDLNAALGETAVKQQKLTDIQRANALAMIFESRAGLAAAILTQDGANKFAQARAELSQINVTDIAGVVLSTLNSQLGRLAVAAQEVAREFGKPLLKPLADEAKKAVEFIAALRPAAQLAGQAVQVALTGEGFAALVHSIEAFTGNEQLTAFFANLIYTGRLVVVTVTNQIVPAIQNFFATLAGFSGERASIDNMSDAFDRINRVIMQVGAATQIALPMVAEFIKEWVDFTGTGGTVRATIENLARSVGVSLLTGLLAVAPATSIAIVLMAKLGEVSAHVASSMAAVFDRLAKMTNVWEQSAGTLAHTLERNRLLGEQQDALRAGWGDRAKEIGEEIARLDEARNRQMDPATAFESRIGPRTQELKDLRDAAAAAAKFNEDVVAGIGNIGEQSRKDVQDVLTLVGTLSDSFSNLMDMTREAADPVIGTGSRGAAIPPDPAAIAAAKKRLEELQADLGRKLSNINEDVITKNRELLTNALERIDDIFERAADQIERLADDTRKRIKELNDAFAQGRADRRVMQFASEGARVEIAAAERAVEAQQKLEDRALEATRRARQRNTEDAATSYQRQTEVAERSFSQQQEAAERAFKVIQDARKESLDKQQELETKQLSQQLEDAATQRKLQQELAAATTPQERQAIQQKAGTAAQDTAFSRSQAAQLAALQAKHEKQRKTAERAAETEQIAFRQQQELVVAAFRIRQEGLAVVERRRVEEAERVLREREDDNAQAIRQGREEQMRVFRETKEQEVAAERDRLDLEAHERAKTRIREEAALRREELITTAGKQAGEQLTEFDRRQSANLIEAERSLRGVQQSLQDTIENFIKEGTLPPGAERVVAAIGAAVGQARQALVDAQAVSRETLSSTIQQSQQALIGPTPEQQQALLQQAIVPAGAAAAALQVVLPPNFHILIRDAFVAGLQYAATNGILPTQQVQITQGSTPQQIQDAARRGVLGR